VSDKELTGLMERVCKAEGLQLHDDVARLVISEANGSPRQMLVNLDLCSNAKDKKEAAQLLLSAQASDATLELCRFLMRRDEGRTWAKAMKIMGKLGTESAEGVRIAVCNYVASVLKNTKNDRETQFALNILEQFCCRLGECCTQTSLSDEVGLIRVSHWREVSVATTRLQPRAALRVTLSVGKRTEPTGGRRFLVLGFR
jgi:DNA polymerase III gamma/tau subunit